MLNFSFSRGALGAAALLGAIAAFPADSLAQASGGRDKRADIRTQPGVILPLDNWTATWATPFQNAGTGTSTQYNNQTLRIITRTSIGGSQVRVLFSNLFGTQNLNIGTARIALRDTGANTVAGSDHQLTFSGNTSYSIPPGANILSDPVAMTVPELSNLAISFYLPDSNARISGRAANTHQSSYISAVGAGDLTAATTFPVGSTTLTSPSVMGVEVIPLGTAPVIVTFGDSITEGFGSTNDTNRRWPDLLKARLYAQGSRLGVVNTGLGGNGVTRDITGPNTSARMDRDVLAQAGVKYATLLIGINDIGGGTSNPSVAPTATQIIAQYRMLIARAHDRGVKIIGCTMTPVNGNGYYSVQAEATRTTVNTFIRNSAEFDGMIDFDAVTRNPSDPTRFYPAFDFGDHLHPNDAGYQAMGNSIDLKLFAGSMTLTGVVSRKIHGTVGTFDLPLPQGIGNTPAIESRGGGVNGNYTVVFSFATPVTSVMNVAVAEGTGSVASSALDPVDARNVIVNLTGVTAGQYVSVGLTNVTDGTSTSSVRASFGILAGDVGGDGAVNAADVAQIKSLSGQTTSAVNFRADLNGDGLINAADVALAKSRSGTSLPAAPVNVNP